MVLCLCLLLMLLHRLLYLLLGMRRLDVWVELRLYRRRLRRVYMLELLERLMLVHLNLCLSLSLSLRKVREEPIAL